jgi:hypothetical protein
MLACIQFGWGGLHCAGFLQVYGVYAVSGYIMYEGTFCNYELNLLLGVGMYVQEALFFAKSTGLQKMTPILQLQCHYHFQLFLILC